MFSVICIRSTPRVSPTPASPFPPYLLALAFTFNLLSRLLLSCNHQAPLYSTSYLSPHKHSRFTRLRCPVLFQLARLELLPLQPPRLWSVTAIQGIFLCLILIFQPSHISICLSGYMRSSGPNALLLVVPELLCIFFLAAVICTVNSCFTNFAFFPILTLNTLALVRPHLSKYIFQSHL